MCIIIDASVASQIVASPPNPNAQPVIEWLTERDGRLVYGGQLTRELFEIADVRRWLLVLDRAGRARQFPSSGVDSETEKVERSGICRSDDPHIIALARLSGARLLYTNDGNLEIDFTNKALISRPGGKIYKRRAHSKLLRHTPLSCGVRTVRRRARR